MALEKNFVIIAIFIILGTLASHATSRTLYEYKASIAAKHDEWMSKYGRLYLDNTEKERRFAVFKSTVEFVAKFNNEGNKPYKVAINQFSDMTEEEFLTRYTGYKVPTLSTTGNESFMYESLTDVPANIDWKQQGAVTSVKNQHSCGCCWAFSAVAAVEGITQIKTGQLISLSEQELVNCNTDNHGCNGGNMLKAFEYIRQNGGITSEDMYPYQSADGNSGMCDTSLISEKAAQITSYERVPSNSENNLLKAVSMQPVSVAISIAGQDFRHYAGGVFTGDDCGTNLSLGELNHAVTIVGYGTTENGVDYWLIKNSWGEGWGESGYMKILRNVEAAEGTCGLAMFASYPTI